VDRPPADRPLADRVGELLRELGPRLRRGGAPAERVARLPTGFPELDRLLAGGFPRGRLCEIAGPASCGRTSLALALLAEATRAGEVVAVADGADAFDPASAQAAGVVLERVLWMRARRPHEALRGAERLLEAQGFAIVLLDLAEPPPRVAPAAWLRLGQAAAAAGTALVVLSQARATGAAAMLALELAPARARFTGTPALLEAFETEIALVRQRAGPPARAVSLRLRSPSAA
jgi:RecA/RadA recombinase